MSDLNARYEAWSVASESVRSSAIALDDMQLRVHLQTWIRCALDYVNSVPLFMDEEYVELPHDRHRDLIWEQMCTVSWIGTELCNATQHPGAQVSAKRCITELTAIMRSGIGDTHMCAAWEDLCNFQDVYCFQKPLEGDPHASLAMLLLRCSSYNGGDICWYQIQDFLQTSVDYKHRMLHRFLMLVATLGQLPYVTQDWYELAQQATFFTSRSYNESLTVSHILKSLTRDEPNGKYCELQPLRDLDARQMIMSMRSTHKRLYKLYPRPVRSIRDRTTYLAGLRHVEASRKALYNSLWRKCFKLRTVALYWQEMTQKRICAPDGAGRAADLAVISYMFQ